jgi:TetR/AcrR family transcriptional repressor of nem operon
VRREGPATEAAIIELGRKMVQVGGYEGLNYGQIAAELGITRTAIHHYFPNKQDLAYRIIIDYRAWTRVQLRRIGATSTTLEEKLARYVDLFSSIAKTDQLMCPGGMLAANAVLIPENLRDEVRAFFDDHVDWVAEQLIDHGDSAVSARRRALQAVAALEGALLLFRLNGRPESFESVIDGLVPALLSAESRLTP